MTYKTGAALVIIAVTAAVLISYLAPARKKDRVTPAQRYQTIDELLAPKLRHGWTRLSAPDDDGGLYKIGGFAYSAPELAGRSWTPKFRSHDEVLEYTVDTRTARLSQSSAFSARGTVVWIAQCLHGTSWNRKCRASRRTGKHSLKRGRRRFATRELVVARALIATVLRLA